MKKTLFIILAALMSFTGLYAQVEFTEVTIEGDGPTEVETPHLFQKNYFRVTANQTGTLLIDVGFNSVIIYPTDVAGSVNVTTALQAVQTSTGTVYVCDVEEGKPYFFRTTPVVDPVTFKFSYGEVDKSIEITSNYENGALYDKSGRNLELTINQNVRISSYTVTVDNNGTPETINIPSDYVHGSFSSTSYYVTVNLFSLVDDLMDRGLLEEGQEFTVTLNGITSVTDPDEVYGEDGSYSITLTYAGNSATVTNISPADGSQIYTYYPADSDKGLITFTFSDQLNPSKDGVNATVSYGYMEAGSYRSISVPFTIEGNTVVVDLRGITFPESVEGGRGSTTTQQTQIRVALSGLTTTDGRGVLTNYPTAGTSAVLAFFNVVKEEINYSVGWYPDLSQTLIFRQDKEVNIYITVPINYDGVSLTFWDARGNSRTVTRTKEEVPFVWSSADEAYVATVSLSGTTFYNDGIIISVINASLMNGDPITIEAQYDGAMPSGIDNAVTLDVDDNTVVKVYSVDGVLVKEGAAGTVLNGLAKGIYIVNGKKYVVK